MNRGKAIPQWIGPIAGAVVGAVLAFFWMWFFIVSGLRTEVEVLKKEVEVLQKERAPAQESTKPQTPTQGGPELRIRSRFSFEVGPTGWMPQDYKDSRACIQVLQSKDLAQEGTYSLKMIMDLVGGHPEKSKGEAWVNLVETSPGGETFPADFSSRTITAWIYAPPGARGDGSKPNGFQLFAKDKDWRSLYGTWRNIVEGQWTEISLAVGNSAPHWGYMDPGFDPTQVVAIGVKMGAGGGSVATFTGAVYLDAVDWR